MGRFFLEFGLAFTVEELAEKKKFFEDELAKQKATLAKPLRYLLPPTLLPFIGTGGTEEGAT